MKPSKNTSLLVRQIQELEYKAALLQRLIDIGKTDGELNEMGHHLVTAFRHAGENDLYIAERMGVNVNTFRPELD